MNVKLFQVDAFTDQPFCGNPAAVCLLDCRAPESWMREMAAEMNLSETAFLVPEGEDFGLRWFTPQVEVDLCGHATLASAHVLFETRRLSHNESARFHTRSGLLLARRDESGWIELDLPNEAATASADDGLLGEALGVQPSFVGQNRMDYIVQVPNEHQVLDMKPNMTLLKKLGGRGVIVTAAAETGPYDFVSRFFAPAAGVDEDPVTGSAHCCLGPFWADRLGKHSLLAYQASSRGGVLRVRVGKERVYVSGQAITLFSAALAADALPEDAYE